MERMGRRAARSLLVIPSSCQNRFGSCAQRYSCLSAMLAVAASLLRTGAGAASLDARRAARRAPAAQGRALGAV